MQQSITAMYDKLPILVRIILQIFLGGLIGGIYRILRYLETKNTTTLVVGVISLFTGGVFGILWVIDLVTEITKNRITVLAD